MAALCGLRRLLLGSVLVVASLAGELHGATLRSLVGRPGSARAYVVFCGRVVAVDLDKLKIVKRFDFFHRRDLMWMAESASILRPPGVLSVTGYREGNEQGEYGVAFLSLPDLVPIPSAKMAGVRPDLATPQVGGPSREAGGVVVGNPAPDRFDVLDARTRRSLASTTLKLPSAGSVYECVRSWTVVANEPKLLVLTAGGFKEQAYLRVYSLPSLTLLRNMPLLEILDDSPVELLVDQP